MGKHHFDPEIKDSATFSLGAFINESPNDR
jgi:hypothetical protein